MKSAKAKVRNALIVADNIPLTKADIIQKATKKKLATNVKRHLTLRFVIQFIG